MLFRFLSVGLLCCSATVAVASDVSEKVEKDIRAQLGASLPALNITSIEKTPFSGLFEVSSTTDQPLLVSADGKYIIAGEVYQLDGHKITNLTEQKREISRAAIMATIPESEKLSFIPEGQTKATITVFTDIDCGYCRKLHKEVPQLNAMGVRVDYLGYPRAGVGSGSYNKLMSAWCADDPMDAMTKAKNGKTIPAKSCENPIARHLQLGQRVGVNGTPAIVLDSGKLLPGYAPADALAKQLGVL
ncbi:DsbC family protein [Alkalimarinus sediminis]|uniref:Thiol:disulfide interchange protein n=1 Tax=Alkalimarinus sediminis TaxID=1632866 RepID=A0A9E8KMK7_9ALTE|nr:DsbC family protein [Alkalimarinus sediminis]UZW73523.1 DsbC family protein [Alkalimarinus sediminis]